MSNENTTPPGKAISAWNGKCPRCRTGKMFEKSLISFSPMRMHRKCPHCGLLFEKEPGYFYAAMYVSYVFVVAQIIGISMLTYFVSGNSESPWLYLVVVCSAIILLAPFNYRYSRIVLLYWMTPGYKFRQDYFLYGDNHPSSFQKSK